MAESKVSISFEGRALQCRNGTSVAVALWECGIRHLSHSPKYGHRRGVTCARGHCTACLMRVDGVPNVRVCETPVRPGMDVRRQDTGAVYGPVLQKTLSVAGSLFPVGFYFKWFTRPMAISRLFLRSLRPLAGVGRLPEVAVPEPNPATITATEEFDAIIVGAGPAGLRLAANWTGRVLVVDDHGAPGGQRAAALDELAGQTDFLEKFPCLATWQTELTEARRAFAHSDHVIFRGGSRAVAGFRPNAIVLREGDRLHTARADEIIWAAGALDTLGLFPGNDTPGVIGPRALYRLLTRDGLDLSGRDVVVIGGGLDLWLCAALLAAHGARLRLVVTEPDWPAEMAAAAACGWPLHGGITLASVTPRRGQRLRAIFKADNGAGGNTSANLKFDADLAVICGRAKPTCDIPYQLGADLKLSARCGGFVAASRGTLSDATCLTVVGEAAGEMPGAARPVEAAPNNPRKE